MKITDIFLSKSALSTQETRQSQQITKMCIQSNALIYYSLFPFTIIYFVQFRQNVVVLTKYTVLQHKLWTEVNQCQIMYIVQVITLTFCTAQIGNHVSVTIPFPSPYPVSPSKSRYPHSLTLIRIVNVWNRYNIKVGK